MSFEIVSGSRYKVSVTLEAFGGDRGFATDEDEKMVRPVLVHIKNTETNRFASVRAMMIVDLYPASSCLKPSMSSPMYLNLAQSRKLVRLPPDREEHFIISCSNSWQAFPHRRRGRSRAERSMSVVAPTVSASEPRTPLKASSSSSRSRTRLG